jgi:polycystin 1L2
MFSGFPLKNGQLCNQLLIGSLLYCVYRALVFTVWPFVSCIRLGPIDKIRVWHDNKGKSPSWNVDRIQVKDMQSREVFSFIFSDWMSVDSDTGLIDVEISSATDKDMKRFWNIFSMQTSRGFSERHLWLSVVERPARNRFTRVQRVSCCLCLFISFITASAMWYGIAPEGKTDFDLGFVELSYQQIGISVMAIAVTFPLNMLWITMFRKARVKTDGNSAVDGGGDNSVVVNNCQTDDPVLLSYNQLTLDVHAINDSKFTGSSKSSTSPVSVEDLDNGENSRQRYGANIASNNETIEEEPSASNKCRLELPHYFVYVAYIGCFTTCLAGSVIILIYGQQFGRTKALQWVASMFLSFFESILFFEPIKVLVIATFLALLVKPKSAIDDDIVYNARVKHIEGMEMGEVKVLTDDDRAAARTRRQKHKHMINVIWEIVLYFIFLWLVAVIAYTDRDERAFYMTKISERVFDVEESFSEIKTGENFFEWANSTLVDGLYWDRWYNSDPVHYSGFTKGDVGKLLGGARLRQIRVKNGSCNVPGTFEKQIKECYSQKKAGNERGSFGLGWTDSGNTTDPPWRWSSVSELDGVAYWGKLDVYSGDGYVQYLENTRSKARNVLATLKDNLWIDRQTRAVFVEFTLYNANANLFQSVTFLIEFPATGGAVPSYQFLSVRLIRYISSLDSLKMACEIMFIFFILLYTYRFCKEARNTGIKAFMKFFWTWVDICLLLLSYAAIIYAIYRIVAINDLLSRYSASRGQFINFYPTVLANMAMQYVLAFLGFLVTVKVLKLFRFNRRLTMLGLVLKTAAWEIFSILVFLVAVLWTFAQFGYLVLQENAEFHSLGAAMVTLISTTLGEFDFYGWVETNRIIAPIMFSCFNLLVLFILLSVFVAILNISVNDVRQALLEQSNDFEVLDFMLGHLRLWLGVNSKVSDALNASALLFFFQICSWHCRRL